MTWLSPLFGVFAITAALCCCGAWLVRGVPTSDMDVADCVALHAVAVFAAGLWALSKSEAA